MRSILHCCIKQVNAKQELIRHVRRRPGRGPGLRPGATAAQDLEPEYIAVSPDSTTAWVTLQENNARAVVDIASATVTSLVPLGTKDHSLPRNALDPSDRDGGTRIADDLRDQAEGLRRGGRRRFGACPSCDHPRITLAAPPSRASRSSATGDL